MIRRKILLLGDFGVGKTSLIRRYVDHAFDDNYLTTIGVKISRKLVTIDEIECELLIWDIEGSTSLRSIPYSYFKGARGAVFVCDVNRQETIENLDGYIQTFTTLNWEAHHVIAYNKSDLLTVDQQEDLRRTLPDNALLTSAKEDVEVESLFVRLAGEMLR